MGLLRKRFNESQRVWFQTLYENIGRAYEEGEISKYDYGIVKEIANMWKQMVANADDLGLVIGIRNKTLTLGEEGTGFDYVLYEDGEFNIAPSVMAKAMVESVKDRSEVAGYVYMLHKYVLGYPAWKTPEKVEEEIGIPGLLQRMGVVKAVRTLMVTYDPLVGLREIRWVVIGQNANGEWMAWDERFPRRKPEWFDNVEDAISSLILEEEAESSSDSLKGGIHATAIPDMWDWKPFVYRDNYPLEVPPINFNPVIPADVDDMVIRLAPSSVVSRYIPKGIVP